MLDSERGNMLLGYKIRPLSLALLAGLICLIAFQSKAQTPGGDAYAYCSNEAATNLPLDTGFDRNWAVFERPSGEYPDGSIEATSSNSVYFRGGVLHLVARKTRDNFLGDLVRRNSFLEKLAEHNSVLRASIADQFMSGRISSYGQFKFGCIEFTAKLPQGRGYWPALWMRTPYGQPTSGEIDVVEGFGSHPKVFQSTLHHWRNGAEPNSTHRRIINGVDRTFTCARVVASASKPNAETQLAIKKARWAGTDRWHLNSWLFANAETPCQVVSVDQNLDFSRDFHRFMVVWTPTRLIWALDGKPYYETTDDIPQSPMIIIMNLSVGKMDGQADATTPLLGELQVRSVRVMALRR